MFKKSRTTRILFLGVLFVIIAAALATYVYYNPIPSAKAAPPRLEPVAPEAVRTNCIISDVFVTTDRIHVRCTTAWLGISFYAIHSDAAHSLMANRYLVMLNTAFALGKPVDLWYNSQAIANPPGCETTNCRLMTGIFIYP